VEKKYEKVFFEIFTREGYKRRWIYRQRHMKFSESDIPDLFTKRSHQDQEKRLPEYLYRMESNGIHIGLFYDGLPESTA
jgi:hypothetical protein